MRVLTLNAGSSTLKAHVVEGDRVVAERSATWTPADRATVLGDALVALGLEPGTAGSADGPVEAVAHRIVHGGERFTAHAVLDAEALTAIDAVRELAPLHNEAAVETIRTAREHLPDVPHVACFDTAFHATLPAVARREPLPASWAALGIRRYGFHGLSVEWSAGRAAELLGRSRDDLDLVVAHLGGGASVTAVHGGRSAWSSMGWTPNDGIMMGTRSGALDPAIVTAMIRDHGRSPVEIDAALEGDAGLRGVSGRSGDVRELTAAAEAGDADARLALDLFAARAAAGIAGAASWLPRVDAIVFTGGIGENAADVRAAIVRRLAVLGAEAIGDGEPAESGPGGDRILSRGRPAVLRVAAREELVMARAATGLLAGRSPS